jgi:hypothetical protein
VSAQECLILTHREDAEPSDSLTSFVSEGGGRLLPSFSIPVERARELQSAALRKLGPTVSLLTRFWRVYLDLEGEPIESSLPSFIRVLEQFDEVEAVDVAGRRVPWLSTDSDAAGDVEDDTFKVEGRQLHLSDDGGVDAVWSWDRGGTGAGVKVCDCECGFGSHPAFPDPRVIFDPLGDLSHEAGHGTAVLGILGAASENLDLWGIAHGATLLFSSTVREPGCEAVGKALEALDAGDVLLLEMQWRTAGSDRVPVEYDTDIREAIVTAGGNDIIVVEPAGNGGKPLKWLSPLWGQKSRFNSLAAMVGAGYGGGEKVPRSWFKASNYGKRVDCQGWGTRVITACTIYRRDGSLVLRGDCLGATSAAAAIIAGVVACLQSLARELLTPERLRSLLQLDWNGGRQQGKAAEKYPIGPLPNIRSIVENHRELFR